MGVLSRGVDKQVLEVDHRIMKKHFTVLMTLLLLSFTALWVSCKTEEAPKEEINYHSQIVGQWIDDNNTFWEFYSDGRFVKYVIKGWSTEFSFGVWEVLRDELTLYKFPYAPNKEETISEFYHSKIGGNTMTLSLRSKNNIRLGSQLLQRQVERPWVMEYIEQKIEELPKGYFITLEEFKRQKETYEFSYNPQLPLTRENLLGRWIIELAGFNDCIVELLPNGELWIFSLYPPNVVYKGEWEYKDKVLSLHIKKGACWSQNEARAVFVEDVPRQRSSMKLLKMRKDEFFFMDEYGLREAKSVSVSSLFEKEKEIRQFLSQN